jgi:hypothetical protein
MNRLVTRLLMVSVCLFALHAFAEENRVVKVGVAIMQSQTSHIMPGDAGRNRLVSALDQQKDKKHHLKLQGVPLEGTTPEAVSTEAKQQKCDYVVYTSLVDLQQTSSGNVMQQPQSQPGGMQPNPSGGLGMPPNAGNPNAGGMGQGAGGMNQGYRATVEYRLYRAGDASPVATSSVTGQQAGPDEAVVAQVLNQVANRVLAEVKKAPPPAQQ